MYATLGMLTGGIVTGYPELVGSLGSEHTSGGAARNVTLPSVTVNAGDLLVIAMGSLTAVGISASGWTTIGPDGGADIMYKVAVGGEGGSVIAVTTGLSVSDSGHLALVYRNVDTAVEGDFELASSVNDTPDPPPVTAGWGAASNLVTAMWLGGEANVTGYPSNCPLYQAAFQPGEEGSGVACAETTSATFDPTIFTISATPVGKALTFILKGAA